MSKPQQILAITAGGQPIGFPAGKSVLWEARGNQASCTIFGERPAEGGQGPWLATFINPQFVGITDIPEPSVPATTEVLN